MVDKVHVNGVFEGGGAKGVAYVGALRAAEEAGLDFRAVAGSSAGAITAALVACGYKSERIGILMPEALDAFGGRLRAALSFHRRSVLSSRELRVWLRKVIHEALRKDENEPVRDWTFAELRAVTQVDLCVVTTDLGDRQPLVLSPYTTPNANVADAVVASCAIPVAFPTQRVEIDVGDRREVHRLVDGGVWANYPSFIFLDEEFRSYHGFETDQTTRPTIGFVLDMAIDDDRVRRLARLASVRNVSPRLSMRDRGSAARQLGTLGAVMTSPWSRLGLLVLPVLTVALAVQKLHGGLSDLAGMPVMQDVSVVPLFGLLSAALVLPLLALLLLLRLGASLLDEGAVGVTTGLGVGPSVPYWVGRRSESLDTGPTHVAIRLPVPAGLGTLSFRDRNGLHGAAIDGAYRTAGRELAAVGYPTATGAMPPPIVQAQPKQAEFSRRRVAAERVVYLLACAGGVIASTFIGLRGFERSADEQGIEVWVAAGFVALLLFQVGIHGAHRRNRARSVTAPLSGLPAPALVGAAALATLVGVLTFVQAAGNARAFSYVDGWKATRIDVIMLGVDESKQGKDPAEPNWELIVPGARPEFATDDLDSTDRLCGFDECWSVPCPRDVGCYKKPSADQPVLVHSNESTIYRVDRQNKLVWPDELDVTSPGQARASFLWFASGLASLAIAYAFVAAAANRRYARPFAAAARAGSGSERTGPLPV